MLMSKKKQKMKQNQKIMRGKNLTKSSDLFFQEGFNMSKIYQIEVEEILQKVVEIEADSLEEAIKEAYRLSYEVQFEKAYRRSDIGQRGLAAYK